MKLTILSILFLLGTTTGIITSSLVQRNGAYIPSAVNAPCFLFEMRFDPDVPEAYFYKCVNKVVAQGLFVYIMINDALNLKWFDALTTDLDFVGRLRAEETAHGATVTIIKRSEPEPNASQACARLQDDLKNLITNDQVTGAKHSIDTWDWEVPAFWSFDDNVPDKYYLLCKEALASVKGVILTEYTHFRGFWCRLQYSDMKSLRGKYREYGSHLEQAFFQTYTIHYPTGVSAEVNSALFDASMYFGPEDDTNGGFWYPSRK